MSRTVDDALAELLPNGTGKNKTYDRLPDLPTTLFGAVAYLLERGGVYHRLVRHEASVRETEKSEWGKGNLIVESTTVAHCTKLGRTWFELARKVESLSARAKVATRKEEKDQVARETQETIQSLNKDCRGEIQNQWDRLTQSGAEPIVDITKPGQPLSWWDPALRLLIIADEASRDLGYVADNPFETLLRAFLKEWDKVEVLKGSKNHFYRPAPPQQFDPLLNPSLVRVMPKSRTPSVGCTMRTMSHNLAIVPPQGIVNVNWFREPQEIKRDCEPLNLLLIPFPYRISSTSFRPVYIDRSQQTLAVDEHNRAVRGKVWGRFSIDQTWLQPPPAGGVSAANGPEEIASFVEALLKEASTDAGEVHGIVFPEYALDWATYSAIVQRVIDAPNASGALRSVDFLVAGISSLDGKQKGNLVATTTFSELNGQRLALTHARSKHHRWLLTPSQITDYALGAALDPNVLWWESIDIPNREIDLTVFRKGAVFSAMICEDLARSEPCHEPLRSVGPNLVFVLLMDGAQLPGRWPSRYATTLADDPGSSVLTLTSLALMNRTNETRRYPVATRQVSIWKDDTANTVPMECPVGAEALLLTLVGEQAEECTIDGRPNYDAQAWRYRGHQPVRLSSIDRTSKKWEWITS